MWEDGASAMEKDLSSSLFSLLVFVIILMCGLVVQLSRPQTWSERADSEADLFLKTANRPYDASCLCQHLFQFSFQF